MKRKKEVAHPALMILLYGSFLLLGIGFWWAVITHLATLTGLSKLGSVVVVLGLSVTAILAAVYTHRHTQEEGMTLGPTRLRLNRRSMQIHGLSLSFLLTIFLQSAFGIVISPALKIPWWHGAIIVPAFLLIVAQACHSVWPKETHPNRLTLETQRDNAALTFTVIYCWAAATIIGSYAAPFVGMRPAYGALLSAGAFGIILLRFAVCSSIAPPVRRPKS